MSDLVMVVCHGGPADHFVAFVGHLPKAEIYATDLAAEKFRKKEITVKILKDTDPDEMAKAHTTASFVLTDVGDPFSIKVQKAFAAHAPRVLRLAYYDNPEPSVPGGYMDIANEVMKLSNRVLFANAHLAKEPTHVGIGYFSTAAATAMQMRRSSSEREELRKKYNLPDQKVLVYFGGNNTTYFNDAFPAFLRLLKESSSTEDLSSYTIVIQQHPGAKEKKFENQQLEKWQASPKYPKLLLSNFPSDAAQVIADGAFYYQTSMSPQFVLAGIPAIQVGHEKFEDVVVKNNIVPSATTAAELLAALKSSSQTPDKAKILEGVGYKEEWVERLKAVFK